MADFSKKDICWWIDDPCFDKTSWWMNDEKNCVEIDDPRLLAGMRPNGTRLFRPGPIYWEILRRHPSLPKLRRAARGDRASNLEGSNLIKRLSVLDKRLKGPAFYLILLYERTWINLEGDVPNRFERYLPGFSQAAHGERQSQLRAPKPSVDLLHESYSELGHLASIGSFIREVATVDLDGSGRRIELPESEVPRKERVLLLDRLEGELKRFGMELSLFAILENAGNGAISDSIQRSLEEFREAGSTVSKGRLQPDVLSYFHEMALAGSCSATARKKLNNYFSEFSFSEMIRNLHCGKTETADAEEGDGKDS